MDSGQKHTCLYGGFSALFVLLFSLSQQGHSVEYKKSAVK